MSQLDQRPDAQLQYKLKTSIVFENYIEHMCKTQDFRISPNYAHEDKYWKRICVNFYWQKEKKLKVWC